ncbi:MurR/RpiR family transcriptional regulator [Virgibacillus soli]|uniref:MurR/RpiR family transcriptional regulator n=1 Tax=Paracerasibacillus soli TaxID=480284 RepID=A0ABU5CWP0_9BACI|nr:MurR/RpiR family transcriptional regulator [Virgibacillus soli]MDY0410291.1 MurR/RpiR family transcriptional regulator [Virgibacillus soli]
MGQNVFQHIGEQVPRMSKAQTKIASYILENQHSAPFLTVGKLAKLSKVSEATIVRFATFLGFSGYNEFQQAMYDSVEKQLNTVERLQMSRSVYSEAEKSIYEVFEDDMANIQATMETLAVADMKKAAQLIMNAKNVYIIANRSAVSLGVFLQYYLEIITGKSKLIDSSELAFEQMYQVSHEDVIIGISFARYTKRTIDIVSHAKKRDVKVIAITDSLLSPITQYATVSLIASSKMPSFFDSFVAPLSLINALIAYIGHQQQDAINKRLEKLEHVWDEYGVFYKNNNPVK